MKKILIIEDSEFEHYKQFKLHRKLNLSLSFITIFILFISFCTVIYLYSVDYKYSGRYDKFTDIILIKGYDSVGYMQQVALHEIGHHVYFKTINETQRNYWNELYQKSLISEQNPRFVTNYAETNEKEDFSETFMFTKYNDQICQKINVNENHAELLDDKFAFMCKLIKTLK